MPAPFRCTSCEETFCHECVRVVGLAGGKRMTFCPACDGPCEALAPVPPPRPALEVKMKSFFVRLSQTLKMPFNR